MAVSRPAEVVKGGKDDLEEANTSAVVVGDNVPQEVGGREGAAWVFAWQPWREWAAVRGIDDDKAVLIIKYLVRLQLDNPADAEQRCWRRHSIYTKTRRPHAAGGKNSQ